MRKAKKAPLTKTAVDGIRKEAAKAGLTLEAAIRECCAKGWAGFKAEWVAAKEAPKTRDSPESFRERDDRLAKERWEQMTGRKHPDLHPRQSATVIDITPAAATVSTHHVERISQ